MRPCSFGGEKEEVDESIHSLINTLAIGIFQEHIVLMVPCNIFRCDRSFWAVLCAGFGYQPQFLAQVVDSIGKLCSVSPVATKVLRLDAPGDDKTGYLHFVEVGRC